MHSDTLSKDDRSTNHDGSCCCTYLPKRYLVAILTFLGLSIVYILRINLSVALVAMVTNQTALHDNGTEYVQKSEFNWNTKVQGLILSSFYYGYIIPQIPGGFLASKYGGRNLFGAGVLMTSLLTLITAPVARASPYLLVALRIFEGLFESVTYPSMMALWGKWAPPLERSKLATISYSGEFAGTIIGMLGSGLIASKWNWPAVFYISGVLGIIWTFFWFLFVADSPQKHGTISNEELKYISDSLEEDHTDEDMPPTPWKEIFTSLPVWALIVGQTTALWGFYTLITELPSYLKKALHYNMKDASLISSLPYIVLLVVVQLSGQLADFLRSRQYMSTTTTRKVFNSVGMSSQAVMLLAVGYTTSAQSAVVVLILAVSLGGFLWSGVKVNNLDISPRYAGTVYGIGNCAGTLAGIISPLVTGYLTSHDTQDEWRTVFFIASGVSAFGCVFYLLFASGEKQPWADGKRKSDIDEKSQLISDDDL